MCFGGGKQRTPELPPTPPPAPIPIAADVSPTQTAQQKRNKVLALQYGAMSTIKAGGMTGRGADLGTSTAGAGGGQKTTLGG